MPDFIFYLISFLLGLAIGSFLNVVIYRYNTGQKVKGRSFCFTCRVELRWFELIPLFSFFFQRARCRSCGSLISLQYPLVELSTGLIFLALFWQNNPLWQGNALTLVWETLVTLLFYWLIAAILVVIAVYDLRHKIIPDHFVYAFIALSFFTPIIINLGLSLSELVRLVNGVFAALLFFLFFWALWRYSDGRWMGFGDAKLVIGIGLLLGLPLGSSAIVIAFWLGAIVGLMLILFRRLKVFQAFSQGITPKSEIPFAPFLVLATLLVLVFGWNIFPI